MSKSKVNIVYFTLVVLCTSGINLFAQHSIDKAIKKYNSGSIPYIYVDELKLKLENTDKLVLLDTRSFEEFEVSRLKGAVWVGYKTFDKTKLKGIDRNSEIIVYCSVGVRSEKIGERLKALGFKNIKNLYGGVFLWVNKGYPVYKNEHLTEEIHSFNNRWEKYINNGIKVN